MVLGKSNSRTNKKDKEANSRDMIWAHHRFRVKTAKPQVDCWNYVDSSIFRTNLEKVKHDLDRTQAKVQNDLRLLSTLNKADLMGGVLKTFNENAVPFVAKSHKKVRLLEGIERDNRHLGVRILSAKAEVGSLEGPISFKPKPKPVFKIPKGFLKKCGGCKVKLPQDCGFIKFFMYPKVYIDIDVRDLMSFGRVEIQLFTEAAPQVVRDIVTICDQKQFDRFNVIRMFVNLWLELEIDLPYDALSRKPLETDKTAFTDLSYMGILSFSENQLKGCDELGKLNFTIAVRPISVLNEARVPFGRITTNYAMLEQVQEFGTRGGKPKKRIVVTDCGVLV